MKKTFAIIGITLASLLVVVLIAVLSVLYIVFTPKRLTPIVSQVANSVLTCEHGLDAVELTFFSTFPYFGVQIDGFYLINPMDGAQSDTVLAVPHLTVAVDLKKAIDGHIDIHDFQLRNTQANIFFAADGRKNIDILKLHSDTLEIQDTTASSWTLKSIVWDETLTIHASTLTFLDLKDSISATVRDLTLDLKETSPADYKSLLIGLKAPETDVTFKGINYANGANLRLKLPVKTTTLTDVNIDKAELQLNQFLLTLDGQVATPSWESGVYNCDLNIATNDWRLSEVLALLPASYASLVPKEIDLDGIVVLQAHAYGQYDSLSMPLVEAQLQLKEAQGRYTELPYYIDALSAEVSALVNLNEKALTTATVRRLYAHTGKSSVTLQGSATQILKNGQSIELGNPLCQMTAKINMDLKEADYFLHSDAYTNSVQGVVTGQVQVKTRLNDLLNGRYHRLQVKSDLALKDLDLVWQDSLLAQAKDLRLQLTLPKKEAVHAQWLTADFQVGFSQLHAQMLSQALDAQLEGGALKTNIEWNTNDSTATPLMHGNFELAQLYATMDTIYVHALAPKGGVSVQPSKKDPSKPRNNLTFTSQAMQAQMGEGLKVNTDFIEISATSVYDRDAENVLLKWNPRLQFDLVNGHAKLDPFGLPEVSIPQIKFNYSNRIFQIDTSRIVLGNSDFSLGGEVRNVGKWLKHEDELVGELRFTSDQTDVNELMTIINNFNKETDTVSTPAVTAETTTPDSVASDPFMVPLQVDLALNTKIRKAFVFDETLENLGGRIYIKDGKLILEEMGFVCEAAKMQLTAIYQTPRRNHIYTGLDFHLLDIDIQNLIPMIPEIDSAVPMLKSFQGAAEFHIALETYLNDKYEPKTSTQRGACSIEGKDLVLMDGETFSKISKILLFSPKTENLIDSISVQLALYKNQVTVYPFCLSIDNYMVAAGGNHYLDMNFNYHASLLKPFYIGVDVKGNLDDLSIKPAKCRYAQDFRPLFHRDVESQTAELRNIISTSLKKSVKIQ